METNMMHGAGFWLDPYYKNKCILWGHFCLLCSARVLRRRRKEGSESIADDACEEEESDSEPQKMRVTG
jgi:hypothetical protein